MTIIAAGVFVALLLSAGLLAFAPLIAMIPVVSRWLEDAEVDLPTDEEE
jgi:hypothetical protein